MHFRMHKKKGIVSILSFVALACIAKLPVKKGVNKQDWCWIGGDNTYSGALCKYTLTG